jgi:hypothetical protein
MSAASVLRGGGRRDRSSLEVPGMRKRLMAAALGAGLLLAGPALRVAAQKGAGEVGFPYGDLKEVPVTGRVISLGDVLAKKYGAETPAGAPRQLALASPEGQLYTFLQNETTAKLAALPAGSAVEVKARLFPRSMLLEPLSFKEVPAATVTRRFYCEVCAIFTEEWGPCVCCGKEVALAEAKPAR